MSDGRSDERRAFTRDLLARHPHFLTAVVEDARVTLAYRGEGRAFRSRRDALVQSARLMWVSDAFLATAMYRAKARLQALRVPILPRIAHRLAMAIAQVCIGDPVLVQPGLYIAHGQVVVDGITEIGPGVVLFPWVTVGLVAGNWQGATIERNVQVGSGAKVLGPITVGADARVGANAVVVDDVPAGATVVGMPARVVGMRVAAESSHSSESRGR